MSNLQYRQSIIQAKRKQTSFRDFVMEICSWVPMMLYRNDTTISVYPPINKVSVIPNTEFHLHRDDLVSDDFQYNIELGFMDNFKLLFLKFKFPATHEYWSNENAQYSELSYGSKNVYLSFMVVSCENVCYSYSVKNNCRNIYSSIHVWNNCDNVFSSTSVDSSSNIFYSKYIDNSNDIWFCENLQWCHDCVMCDWLVNMSYCIENIQYTKEEYLLKKDAMLLAKENYTLRYSSLGIVWFNVASENITGSRVIKSIAVQNWYFIKQVNQWQNLFMVWGKDLCSNLYDLISAASSKTEDVYWCVWCGTGDNFYSSFLSWIWSNLYYCYFCDTCSFCLGCIGLKNKSYYILNKQYTKEDRYNEVDKIFWKMETSPSNGAFQLGSFFPPIMNPFYFNDTAAYLIDPSFTKEEVTAKWYLRRDEPINVDIPAGVQLMKASELDQYEGYDNDWTRILNDEVLKKVIRDDQANAYRIIPMEFEFLKKYNLPLPRTYWLDRMKENFRIN